jgi:hypothetical protein
VQQHPGPHFGVGSAPVRTLRSPRRRSRRGLLHPVLSLRFRRRLPLHVPERIRAATLQWLDVIDDEPRARPRGPAGCRAGIAGLECSSGRRAARDPAVGGAGAIAAYLRRGSGVSDRGGALRSGCGSWRTPRRRAGAAAPGGSPARDRRKQEAESQDQVSDHHGIIMKVLSVVCVGGNRAIGGASSLHPRS